MHTCLRGIAMEEKDEDKSVYKCTRQEKERLTRVNDSYCSWIVCAASFVVLVITVGFQYSFGLIFTSLQETFHKPRAATAWVGTLAFSMTFLLGPLAGVLCQRLGCRAVIFMGGLLSSLGLLLTSYVRHMYIMYLTYGIIFGVGACLSYTVPYIALAESFSKWKSIAMGIASSGISTGQLIMNPLVEHFLFNYQWNGTFRNLSGIFFSICILSLAFPSKNKSVDCARNDEQSLTKPGVITKSSPFKQMRVSMDLRIWRIRYFTIFAISSSVVMVGYHIPVVFMADYCKELNLSKSQATTLYMVMAVTSTISRVLTGVLSDTLGISPLTIAQITISLSGIISLSFTLTDKYEGLLTAMLVYGFCDGAVNVQFPLIVLDSVGLERMPQAWGSVIFLHSLAIGVGSPMAGFLADVTNTYHSTFIFGGGFVFIGASSLFLIRWLKPHATKGSKLFLNNEILEIYERVTVV